jgi:endonuclease/exonuclease/phosphatase family metal-dependent hydrolase
MAEVVTVVAVYMHPTDEVCNEITSNALTEIVAMYEDQYHNLLIAGDFNKTKDQLANQNHEDGLSFLLDWYASQCNWTFKRSKKEIDHILSTIPIQTINELNRG